MLTGGCLCGAVRFEIDGKLGPVFSCHCSQCRRAGGAAFATNAPVRADRFRWVSGQEGVREFESSPGTLRAFCATCGSPVYSRTRSDPESLRVRLGTLDGDPGRRPLAHVWVGSKAPWHEIRDDLPRLPEGVPSDWKPPAPSPARPLSWLSPKTVVRESAIQGRGLFAREAIARDEIVAIKGGTIFDAATRGALEERLGPAEIPVADGFFIGPLTEGEREGGMIFSNHSCEPNLGVRGQIVFVAMRDVAPGEELTHDWAMTDDEDDVLDCRCGTPSCRGRVTGRDWQRKDLQEKYRGYFSWYLQRKIDAEHSPHPT